MLSKEHFKEFIDEVNTVYYNFCIWVQTNNGWVEIKDGYYDNHLVRHMGLILYSLQMNWLLGIARLLDDAYFRNDKNKPRLSVEYILKEYGNDKLQSTYSAKMAEQDMQEFYESNRELRNHKYTHKTPGYVVDVQKAGSEKFFEMIKEIITELKKDERLDLSSSLNYEGFESMAKTGAESFFKIFNTSNN